MKRNGETFLNCTKTCRQNTFVLGLCNKTLSEIYRLLFFLIFEEYKKEFEFNCNIQKAIELIAFERKFDFFDKNPPEVENGGIAIWCSKQI